MVYIYERGKVFGKGVVGYFFIVWVDKIGKFFGWIGNIFEVYVFFVYEY